MLQNAPERNGRAIATPIGEIDVTLYLLHSKPVQQCLPCQLLALESTLQRREVGKIFLMQRRKLPAGLQCQPPALVGAQQVKKQIVDRAVAVTWIVCVIGLAQLYSTIQQTPVGVPVISE